MKRAAAVVLMLALIHQVGACPCGCLEHNHWLKAFGLVGQEPHADIQAGSPLWSGDHCDCSGAVEFVNNAQRVEFDHFCLVSWVGELVSSAGAQHSDARGDSSSQIPPNLSASAEISETLQVFLL